MEKYDWLNPKKEANKAKAARQHIEDPRLAESDRKERLFAEVQKCLRRVNSNLILVALEETKAEIKIGNEGERLSSEEFTRAVQSCKVYYGTYSKEARKWYLRTEDFCPLKLSDEVKKVFKMNYDK